MSEMPETYTIDRLPPCDTDAEEALCGSLLGDYDAMGRVSGFLRPEMFYRDSYRAIYSAALAVEERRSKSADLITVSDELKRQGAPAQVDLPYLNNVAASVPFAGNVVEYGRMIERTWVKRCLIQASVRICAHAYDPENSADASLTFAAEQLGNLTQRSSSGHTYTGPERSGRWLEMLDRIERGIVDYIPTRMLVDRAIKGVHYTDLTVIGAPTGVGKSALLMEWARTMKLNGARVLFCSSEMSEESLTRRDAAAYTGVSWDVIEQLTREHREEARRYWQIVHDQLERYGVTVYYEGDMTTAKIRREVARHRAKGGLDVVYVDYLQRLQDRGGKNDQRYQVVGAMAQRLKSLAMDMGVAVVVASQLKQDVLNEKRAPMLTDFMEASAIEHEADVALGIHRPSAYDDTADLSESYLLVLKNRHGRADVRFPMRWLPEVARYTDPT